MKALDLNGKVFGRLTVIERAENSARGQSRWRCLCECGNITVSVGAKLTSGKTHSCGCLGLENATKAKIKHGDSPYAQDKRARLYHTWASMKRRCYNPNSQHYNYYGGKGVKVCPEWHDYRMFKEWALAHGYDESLQIDRVDSSGDYAPNNCEWVTAKENKRRMWADRHTNNPEQFDLAGRTFSRLIAIETVGKDKHGCILWRCKCVCGGEILATGTRLRRGAVKSCGCLKREASSRIITAYNNAKKAKD